MIKFFEDLLNELNTSEQSFILETARRLAGALSLEPVSKGGDVATAEKHETVAEIRRKNEKLREEIEMKDSQVAVFVSQTRGTEGLVEKANGEVLSLQQDSSRLNDEIQQLHCEQDRRESVINRFLKPYTVGLGLELNKLTDAVYEVVLDVGETNDEHKRVRSHIRLNEDQSFEVTLMEPQHSDAEKLLDHLRTTNNLRRFISDVRSLYAS